MKTEEIISNIKDCIKKSHSITSDLGKSTSITRNYLVENLIDIQSTEIHVGLLELHERGEIRYNGDSGVILILN